MTSILTLTHDSKHKLDILKGEQNKYVKMKMNTIIPPIKAKRGYFKFRITQGYSIPSGQQFSSNLDFKVKVEVKE